MAKAKSVYQTGVPIVCPVCHKPFVFEEMPDGYATKRWGGAVPEAPHLRCSGCTATFPQWGIEQYLVKEIAEASK